MKNRIFRTADLEGLLVCAAIFASMTGCTGGGSNSSHVQPATQPMQAHATAEIQDDYDYFPGREVYYSRNRKEYVYLDGYAWVRRLEPRGVSVAVLLGSPSVRLDFHDSPSHHHREVIQMYPRDWVRPEEQADDGNDRREDRRTDRDDREDQDDRNTYRENSTGGPRSG
jgi:hypothetical protein